MTILQAPESIKVFICVAVNSPLFQQTYHPATSASTAEACQATSQFSPDSVIVMEVAVTAATEASEVTVAVVASPHEYWLHNCAVTVYSCPSVPELHVIERVSDSTLS